MDNEQPHQELVKCVVVGDTAVGKTRLICARACNKQVSFEQLLSTHVPTVWAIDQYRIYKEVLERSWDTVDNVNVTLRLWDTFGDHEKDRRFAYGRSDVVLLCFSVNNPVSLRNCHMMWFPEIRRFCPSTPILLVACKADLRYMYRDETYLSHFRERSPFMRPTRKNDLIMPDEGRAVAHELGVSYYETSVLSYYGVNDVFENATRAALIARKQQRFWMTNLKKVQRPLLQVPLKPPPPMEPKITVVDTCYAQHIQQQLWTERLYTDVVLVVSGVVFQAHRFVLAASCRAFFKILLSDNGSLVRSTSDSSMVSSLGEFGDENETLLRAEQKMGRRRASWQDLPTARDLDHPAFQRIWQSDGQVVVTMQKTITHTAMKQCLQFIYTGTIDPSSLPYLDQIKDAAERLELHQLVTVLHKQSFRDSNLPLPSFEAIRRRRLQDIAVEQGLFSDVIFELDDGICVAHKAMLTSRCDMMKAMFKGDFKESQSKLIVFPGVSEYAFSRLLYYLYLDELPSITPTQCIDILELANRLCLTRMVNLIEKRVVENLQCLQVTETIDHCLKLLEPVKLHNAHQLADWCMWHLCINFNKLCKMSPKSLRLLNAENQAHLTEHRWPPVWYLKDYDYYQKCLYEREQESKQTVKNGSGCLCFSRKSDSNPTLTIINQHHQHG